MSTEFYWLAVGLFTVVAVSRITRFLVADKFPPMKRLRDKYENKTDGSGWEWLTMCGYCMAPWVAVFVIGWADLVGVLDGDQALGGDLARTAWWMFTGWLTVSYLAAILMSADQDKTAA